MDIVKDFESLVESSGSINERKEFECSFNIVIENYC